MFEILDRYAALVDELHAADLHVLSQDELLDVVRQVEVQWRRLACVDHALIARLESRGTAHELVARSTSMLLQQMLRLSSAEAGRRVHAAKRMGPRRALGGEASPPLRAEIAEGQAAGVVSAEQVRVITQELDRLPATTPVDAARRVSFLQAVPVQPALGGPCRTSGSQRRHRNAGQRMPGTAPCCTRSP